MFENAGGSYESRYGTTRITELPANRMQLFLPGFKLPTIYEYFSFVYDVLDPLGLSSDCKENLLV